MRRLVLVSALLGSLVCLMIFAEPSYGFGRNRGCCMPVDCGPAMMVQYVEKMVTAYRPEMREKEIEVTVHKMFPREEKFKYVELVPVTKPEKRKVTEYQTSTKEVEFKYNVHVPVVTPEKRMETYYVCVPEEVVRQVPVCRTVPVQFVDPCTGCCYTVCRRVTEMQEVRYTAMKSVPQQREVTVNVCTYKTEERTGKRLVCETNPVEKEITVNVCSYKTEERTGKRLVCETKPVEKEITVNVCTYDRVEKEGTRTVYDCKPVVEKRKVSYCEMVPYQTTVKVPVYVPCPPAPHHE